MASTVEEGDLRRKRQKVSTTTTSSSTHHQSTNIITQNPEDLSMMDLPKPAETRVGRNDREEQVGILLYVNTTNPGFTGILKQRYVHVIIFYVSLIHSSLSFSRGEAGSSDAWLSVFCVAGWWRWSLQSFKSLSTSDHRDSLPLANQPSPQVVVKMSKLLGHVYSSHSDGTYSTNLQLVT